MSALCRLIRSQRALLSCRPSCRLFPVQQDVCGGVSLVCPTVRTASSSRDGHLTGDQPHLTRHTLPPSHPSSLALPPAPLLHYICTGGGGFLCVKTASC